MSQQKHLSILISGAGVAGMTLALSLARHPKLGPNTIVTILERSPVPRTTGQAIDIRGPAVQLMHELGIEEKIRARHTTETGIQFLDKDGKHVAKFDKTNDPKKQSGTSEYEILRSDLVSLLMEETEAAKEVSGVQINTVYGDYIKALEEEADGVAVTFTNGKLASQKFDVVVAADGASSRTRSIIFPEYAKNDYIEPWGFYVAYFTIPRTESDTRRWRWFQAPGGLSISIRPHRNPDTVAVYFSIMLPTRSRSPELDAVLGQGVDAKKAFLREKFKNVGWEVERLLAGMDQATDFYMHSACRIETPKWTTGRCAIVGDAAYAVMGVGTSNAMIGGYMIAGELAQMASNSAKEVSDALKRYEDKLRPHAAGKDSKPPPGFPQFLSPQSKWGIGVFHTLVKIIAFARLDTILTWFGETSGTWKLPEYGFQSPHSS